MIPSSVSRALAIGLEHYVNRLTARRVRFEAIVLAAVLWTVSFWTVATPGPFDRNGTLKGIDFLQFYTAGRLVATGRAHLLYDWPTFARELETVVPGLGDVLFLSVYPPPVPVMFAPLSRAAAYLPALAIWSLISIVVYVACASALQKALPALQRHRRTWWVLVLGFVPFQQVVMHGQIGTIVLALLTCMFLALRAGRHFWAGAACGALLFKPQFGIAALLLILASRRFAVLTGVCAGALTVSGLTVMAIGIEPWTEYGRKLPVLLKAAPLFEPRIWQMHNVKAFCDLLAGAGMISRAGTLLLSIVVLVVVVRVWRRTEAVELRAAAVVLGAALLNPHLYIYDLVVIGLALGAAAAWALDRPDRADAGVILAFTHVLCWVPLLAPLAAITHVQLTTPFMMALLFAIHSSATRTPGDREPKPWRAVAPAGSM